MGRPGLLGLWILSKKYWNRRSFRSGDGEIFCSGRQFLFSYKIVRRFFDVLVDGSEFFVNFFIETCVRKWLQSLLLVEFGPPNNDCHHPPSPPSSFNTSSLHY